MVIDDQHSFGHLVIVAQGLRDRVRVFPGLAAISVAALVRGGMMNRVTTASPLTGDSRQRRFRIAVVVASVVAAIVGSLLLAARDSGENVTTRGITASLRVPAHPGALAAGEDLLWLALADGKPPVRDRPLLRLELSGAVQQSVLVGGQASHLLRLGNRLLASVEHAGGAGSRASLVVALDWRTGGVLVRRRLPGLVGPLAQDGKYLWALQTRPGALLRLDARTLAPTAAPLGLSRGRTLGLAVGSRYVWVTAADAGEVLRIDPTTRAIRRLRVGGFPAGVVVAGGSVWFADRQRGTVVRLEPRTLQAIGEPVNVGSDASWLAAAGGYVFTGNADRGTVTRIDARSGKHVGPPIRFAQPAKDAPAVVLAPSGSSIWVSSFATNTLTRISSAADAAAPPAAPISNAQKTSTVGRALPGGGEVVRKIAVPPGGGGFAIGEGAVWAMDNRGDTLMRIDPEQDAVVARIRVGYGGGAAAGNDAVWVSHPSENSVSRVDPRTNMVTATIPVGPQPDGVAVSPGSVWVANTGGPSVSRIDAATNKVVATIRVGPTRACCAEHMALTAGADAIWVAVPNLDAVVRVDPKTNDVVATIKVPAPPCGFLVADDTAVWWAGGGCSDVVARINPRTNRPDGPVAGGETHPVGLALGFDSVWVAVLGLKAIDRVDPHSRRVVARLPVGGIPVRIAEGFGAIWVYDDTGRVLRIKPQD
jgi:virginiamycin B lyase